MLRALQHKNFLPAAGAVFLLAVVAAYAATGQYLLLLAPFGVLILGMLVVNWKTAWWMFLFSIPLSMQLEFLGGTLSTSLPDEPMMWLLLLTFVVLFCARPNILPQWWWRSPIVFIVVLQFLWLIVAVAFSQMPFISFKFLLAKCWFLVSFFVFPALIFREKKDFKRGFLLFLIPLVISMVIIIVRHAILGFGFLEINRAIGFIYFNRVDYSTVMSMFFPILIAAVPLTRGLRLWWRALLIMVIILFLPAIYLTFARGAMMAVVFGLLMGIAIRLKLAKYVMPLFYALVASGVMYMARENKYIDYRPDFEHTYTHFTFADHLVATFRGEDMSSMERLYRWIAAVRMSNDKPLTGYGPNSFYYYYKPYAVTSFRTYVSRNNEHSTTHNYFLFMLVEQGWPAMILYGVLVAFFFAHAQKIYHRFKDRFYRHCTIAIAMMFAAGFINNFFSEMLETHKVGALFYIGLALMTVLWHKSKQEEKALKEGLSVVEDK